MPTTAQAPTSPEPRKESIHGGGHANRRCIAIQTAVSRRKNQGEEHRRHDNAEDEQSAEDKREEKQVRHPGSPPAYVLRQRSTFSDWTQASGEKLGDPSFHIVRRTPRCATHKSDMPTTGMELD